MASWWKCGETLLKIIIGVINILIAILGLACIVFGAKVAQSDDVKNVVSKVESGDLLNGTYLIIAVGSIILIIALMGCCGAICANKCLLLSYFIIVALILIAELVGAGLIWKNAPQFEKTLKDVLSKDVENYDSDDVSRKFLDTVQTNLKCCGIEGPEDYVGGMVPQSCLNKETSAVFKDGCYGTVKDYLSKASNVIGGLAMGLTCLQIFCLVAVLCLYCIIRKTASASAVA